MEALLGIGKPVGLCNKEACGDGGLTRDTERTELRIHGPQTIPAMTHRNHRRGKKTPSPCGEGDLKRRVCLLQPSSLILPGAGLW